MEKPNLKDARIRTHNKVNIIRNFKISDELKEIGKNKKYLVKIGGIKGGIIGGVSVKVSDKYYFEMHVDTDDANAHLIDKSNNVGTIIGEDNESI